MCPSLVPGSLPIVCTCPVCPPASPSAMLMAHSSPGVLQDVGPRPDHRRHRDAHPRGIHRAALPMEATGLAGRKRFWKGSSTGQTQAPPPRRASRTPGEGVVHAPGSLRASRVQGGQAPAMHMQRDMGKVVPNLVQSCRPDMAAPRSRIGNHAAEHSWLSVPKDRRRFLHHPPKGQDPHVVSSRPACTTWPEPVSSRANAGEREGARL